MRSGGAAHKIIKRRGILIEPLDSGISAYCLQIPVAGVGTIRWLEGLNRLIYFPVPVISTGGKRRSDDSCKNRYSFEEWRNLSCRWR